MSLWPGLIQKDLLHSDRLRRLLPAPVKALAKRRIPYADYRSEQLRREAEGRLGGPIPMESDYDSSHAALLGIFFDSSYTFAFNVAACRDLHVRYKVIDLLAPDWLQRVTESGCDAFLASPPTLLGIWRRVFEERLWVVAKDLGIPVCPSFEELYLWESKRRMHDWLVAHKIPHPRTWVFVDQDEAMRFCAGADYPLVAKTDSGAASSGVFVLPDMRSARRLVKRAFGTGLATRSSDAREQERGVVLFQRFVPHDFEWRVVRIGDNFMCRKKVRVGAFASGSGDIGWAEPLPGLLDFARWVTDQGGFRHMGVDVFEGAAVGDEPFLVNELQAIVGAIEDEGCVNEYTGCWQAGPSAPAWSFQPGYFYQNACANLRVAHLLRTLHPSCGDTGGG